MRLILGKFGGLLPVAANSLLGQAAPSDWRDADPQEFAGGWEYVKDIRKQNPFCYVAILEDGRIGWVCAEEQLLGATKSSLADLINKGNTPSIHVTSREIARLSPGKIELPATGQHVSECFAVLAGVADQNKGQFVIGQTYRLPPQPPPYEGQIFPPPFMPMLQLHELRRLPD